jgi:hypothetical protein
VGERDTQARMGLRDRASKVLDAFRRGDGRAAADALGDAIESAGVRIMDEVVTRLSGHTVSTTGVEGSESAEPDTPVAPVTPVQAEVPPAKVDLPPAEVSERPVAKAARDIGAPATPEAPVEVTPEAPVEVTPDAPAEATAPQVAQSAPKTPRHRLVLLARDPTWAFAHWDLAPDRLAQARAGLTEPKARLRFYEVGTEVPLVDADVTPDNGRFYLRVPRPDTSYQVRLVFVGSDDTVCEVVRSNVAEPPSQRATSNPEPAVFVNMAGQTAVLDRRDEILVPAPRVIADAPLSRAEMPAFVPRSAQWASVLASVRNRRLAESVGADRPLADVGIGSSEPWSMPDSGSHGAH